MEMKRVVVFLPPQTVKASEALAARYASNRSEALRLAVAEGLQPVRRCLLGYSGTNGGVGDGVPVCSRRTGKRCDRAVASGPAGVVPLDAETAVPQLVQSGVSARRVRPGLAAPDLRLMLATHSEVSGVLPDDIEDAVDGAVAELFGRADVLPVADPNAPPEPPE